MSLDLTVQEVDAIWLEAEQHYPPATSIDRLETICTVSSRLGSGYHRETELYPGLELDIHMQPHLLSQFFAAPTGELPSELQPLVRGDDWQRVFSPKTTPAMRSVVQQILDCRFVGVTKRLYLQSKVFELMALQLDDILGNDSASPPASLKPDTVARIHYAAEIIRSHLEQPPNQTELAQRVGVSDRRLQKGFKALRMALVYSLDSTHCVLGDRLNSKT